ncbi:hypothetical protein MNB_SV-5-1513 [hydrothermal vent metagenome]|uniref:DUF2721 domain-containing protein n=1 Tax=hydrothermal vent metagenome TaxID=652676 RepID=A0A1W1EET9_9ZZZZ
MESLSDPNVISSVAHLIKLSVAPVFLITGIAALINIFVGRLTRIIDRFERLAVELEEKKKMDPSYTPCQKVVYKRDLLLKRLKTTNLAIALATLAGLMVALVVASLFLSSVMKFDNSTFIVILFISAMLFLVLSLILFLREIFYTHNFARDNS